MTRARASARPRLCAVLLAAACGAAQAAGVAYDENTRGDLAGQAGDAVLLTLGDGSTVVTGTLWRQRDAQGAWSFDTDSFRFALAEGLHLDSIAVSYGFEATGAAARGATVRHTLRPDGGDTTAYVQDIDMVGGGGAQALFGDKALAAPQGADGVREFSIAWPQAGSFGGSALSYRYTVALNVGGRASAAAAATAAEVPEPATAAMVGAALLLAAAATRRRARR